MTTEAVDAPTILVVEDDQDVARLVAFQLEHEGFAVTVNATGGGVLEQVASLQPRLVVLDLMLPLAHGYEILRDLRRDPRYAQIPVLLLTALGAESDRVRGLDLGADDYMQKPFSPKELAARVRARLRGAPAAAPARLTAGPLELDLDAHTARMHGVPLELSDTEFRLLAFLMKSPARAFTRRQIVAAVWSPQHFITDRAVDVYMLRLRAKIELEPERPRLLVSVRRVGYRFDA
ncbi:MAG TPA: response regulator transcription factor [Terriglobales bacterium]|nr:response regulator transcription factor [Terriglobales bacterium]